MYCVRRALGTAAVFVLTVTAAIADTLLTPTEPEKVGLSSERLERVGKAFRTGIDEGALSGAVVLVARHGQVAYFESFGTRDPASREPLAIDAIFRIYSMTKPLISVAALTLVEQGTLQLADPVSKFLPEFRELQVSTRSRDDTGRTIYKTQPSNREMTIHDLLRHTAGLAYGEITDNEEVKQAYAQANLFQPGGPAYDSRGMTPEEQVERLASIPLIHEPGTRWEYGLETDLLGRVIERVSGLELGAFLKERLFEPTGMVDTSFYVPESELPRLAEPP